MTAYAALRDNTRDFTNARRAWGPVGVELSWRVEVEKWPPDMRDTWEERSAIIEFDGGFPRPEAERRAYEIVRRATDAEQMTRRGPE